MPAPDLDQLYREHAPRLLRLAVQMTGERAIAEDALHDAFLSAFRARRSFKGNAAPETWIYRIVMHASIQQRERARKTRARERSQKAARPEAGLPRDETFTLRAALDALSDADRAIIGLLNIRELPVRTTSAILGIPEGTVWSRAHAARTRLRAEIERLDQTRADSSAAAKRSAEPGP